MSEFGKLEGDAEQYAKDHPQQVHEGEQDAEHAAESKLGPVEGQNQGDQQGQDTQQDQGAQQDQGDQQDQHGSDQDNEPAGPGPAVRARRLPRAVPASQQGAAAHGRTTRERRIPG